MQSEDLLRAAGKIGGVFAVTCPRDFSLILTFDARFTGLSLQSRSIFQAEYFQTRRSECSEPA